MATSWVAAKRLWTTSRTVNKPRPVIWPAPPASRTAWGNHPMATSRVTIMPAWLRTIHCLRRPKRRRCRLSTNGPMTHFHVHGSVMMARNDPMASPVMPMRLNSRATAVAANPCGRPSLTYKPKNPANRPRREERRSGKQNIRRLRFRRMTAVVKAGIAHGVPSGRSSGLRTGHIPSPDGPRIRLPRAAGGSIGWNPKPTPPQTGRNHLRSGPDSSGRGKRP